MNKTGGVIGIIAGIFAVIAALVTLVFGGVASAFHAERASTVVGLGWGGVVFSFLVIVFAALSFSKAKFAGWGLIVSALLGAVLGGTLVAIFMVLALIGGVLVLLGAKASPPAQAVTTTSMSTQGGSRKVGIYSLVTIAVLICGIAAVSKHEKKEDGAKQAIEVPSVAATVSSVNVPGVSTSTLTELVQTDVTGPEANKLTELGAAPPENQIAAFMRLSGTEKPTEAQQAIRTKAVLDAMSKAKGTVVVWNLVVDNVTPTASGAFKISTKCMALTNKVTPPAQVQMEQPDTEVLLTSRSTDETKVIGSLSACSVLKVKGIVASFDDNTKKVILNPAIIVKAGSYEAHDVKTTSGIDAADVSVKSKPPTETKVESEADNKEETLMARSTQPSDSTSESGNDQLRIADTELNKVYTNLMKSLPVEKRAELKKSELTWIKKKEAACKQDLKCIIQFTEQRLIEISNF